MIIVTGSAGFIGSCLVSKLNNKGIKDVVLVDDFSNPLKNSNNTHQSFQEKVHRDEFFEWAEKNHKNISFIFHIGARTDTTEFNTAIFDKLNVNYSKAMWNFCTKHKIPMLYASSAATYGSGELGYNDDQVIIPKLKPLNPYGESKNNFDKWVIEQINCPPFWAGIKFFNVYGPNEYHKGRMASVVFHAFNQIQEKGQVTLFRSHNPYYEDGKQLRDFIYVKDVIDVLYFFMEHQKDSGIYNLGTGKARTFLDLAISLFKSLQLKENISFIDTPEDIREKYQYFTEANMNKLYSIGYAKSFYTLEEGIHEYVTGYLTNKRYF